MPSLPFEVKRSVLTRAEEETDPSYGTLPHKRSIEELLRLGVVNIDKPPGPTSHQVTDHVKNILSAKRTGHSGTLDPNVTGALPVAVNDATKVVQALLPAGKEYVGVMHLHEPVTKKELKAIFEEFTGELYQTPPVHSAVKRELRTREIYYLELLEFEKKDALFRVGSEAGTYIRRLCHDIGAALGVGAHMQQLRRTKVAAFTEETIVTLQSLTDAYVFWKEDEDEAELRRAVQPYESAVAHFPKVVISDHAVDSITQGAQLAVPGVLQVESGINVNDFVAIFTQKGEGVAMGRALMSSDDLVNQTRGLAVKTQRVFMDSGVYPKYKKG